MSSRDMDVTMARYKVEDAQKWREEIATMPFIQFPADWQIQIIPPFSDAVVRFRVRRADGEERSIYLDSRCSLGYWAVIDEAYWEVYPYRGDVGRCAKNDIPELLRMIADTQEGDDE